MKWLFLSLMLLAHSCASTHLKEAVEVTPQAKEQREDDREHEDGDDVIDRHGAWADAVSGEDQ